MKKVNYLVGISVCALALLSGCISNEESDGVKAIRMAQADKITADANYRTAEIATENARTLQAEATARSVAADATIKELEAALKTATNPDEIASAQAAIAVTKANNELFLSQTQNKIAVELEKAKSDLAAQQVVTEQKLRALATEVAKSGEKVAANEYYVLYSAKLGEIQTLRSEITTLSFEIAQDKVILANYTTDKAIAGLNDAIAVQQKLVVKNNKDIAELEATNVTLSSVILNPSGAQAAKDAAKAQMNTLDAARKAKDVEVAKALLAKNDAAAVFTKKLTAYNTNLTDLNTLPGTIATKKSVISAANTAIANANTNIASLTRTNASITASLTAENGKLAQYNADLTAKKATQVAAQTAYSSSLTARDAAQATYDINPTPANQAALDGANITLTGAATTLSNANTALATAQGFVNTSSALVAGYNASIVTNNNSISLQDNTILNKNKEITTATADLAKAEADYTAAKAAATTVSAEYDAASVNVTTTTKAHADLIAEAAALQASYALQETLYNTVDGSITSLETMIENNENAIVNLQTSNTNAAQTIKDKQEELAAGEQTKAEFAKQITDKEAKLAEKNAQLATKNALAASYKAKLDAALVG